ncbi:GNAT family N-acetyltransferase [Crenobacter intestini]|nr:GNAT family N-acetyltransferase [Crenobacter intestini]
MLRIRPARVNDAKALVALHYAAVHAVSPGHYTPAQLAAWSPLPDAARHAWLRGVICTPTLRVLVGEVDGQPCGFAIADLAEGRVNALYVAPAHAGCGLGRALLAACEHALQAQGHAQGTVRASLNAEAFYAAAGYRALGPALQPLADGSALPCVEMSRPLI